MYKSVYGKFHDNFSQYCQRLKDVSFLFKYVRECIKEIKRYFIRNTQVPWRGNKSITVRNTVQSFFLLDVKNLTVKYLARFSHCEKTLPMYGNVVRMNATKCIVHMSRPEGSERSPRAKSGRLTGVAICPADKTQDRNAYCPSAGLSSCRFSSSFSCLLIGRRMRGVDSRTRSHRNLFLTRTNASREEMELGIISEFNFRHHTIIKNSPYVILSHAFSTGTNLIQINDGLTVSISGIHRMNSGHQDMQSSELTNIIHNFIYRKSRYYRITFQEYISKVASKWKF